MIDLSREQVVPLSEASNHLPPKRGKQTHLSTIHRWAQRGIRDVKLETIQLGGRKCTSVEAIQRFGNALSDCPNPPARPSASLKQAESELAMAGI